MKQLFFTIAFGLAALNASASNDNPTVVIIEQETVSNESQVLFEEVVLEEKNTDFRMYRGRCLDGHEFDFAASDKESAQKHVNKYCAERRATQVEITAP